MKPQPANSFMAALVNASVRRIESMFPGYFSTAKHNHYADFGWPSILTQDQLYGMYQRNGFARAAVDKAILKTWQSNPDLWETAKSGETQLEADIRQRLDDLRFWQRLAEADRRSLVGGFSAVILRFADSKTFDQPVDRVGGGLLGLVEVIPAWAMQITVSQWDSDQRSPTYGLPKMYQFNESALGAGQTQTQLQAGQQRQFSLHPDRVVIWSKDGTVYSASALEPGYNDLMTLEKVSGAGGEGFWKNAKSSPVLEVDKDASIQDMARAMQVDVSEVADAMNTQVEDWQRGFDKLLMLQGMKASTLGVTLPSPEHFFNIALQGVSASMNIPMKILVGSQTGERASTEDARDWAQTNAARRRNQVIPTINEIVRRLERVGILPKRDWEVHWDDLTGSTIEEKIAIAAKMAEINRSAATTRELVFLPEEIRQQVDMDPLTVGQLYPDDPMAPDPGDPATQEGQQ